MRCFSYFLWIVRFLYFILFYHALKKTVKFQFIRAHRLRPWRCCLSLFSILMCAQIAFAMAVKPLIPILMCAQIVSPVDIVEGLLIVSILMCTQVASVRVMIPMLRLSRFNSHVRTDCVIAYQLFQCDIERFNSHVRTGCVLSRVLFWYAEKGFNSHVRTGCVSPPTQRITPHRCFNSHVRTGCVSKNEQKPLLITINHAQLYCLNSSAHSVLLAIKGDLLLLHRCEPPYKIM